MTDVAKQPRTPATPSTVPPASPVESLSPASLLASSYADLATPRSPRTPRSRQPWTPRTPRSQSSSRPWTPRSGAGGAPHCPGRAAWVPSHSTELPLPRSVFDPPPERRHLRRPSWSKVGQAGVTPQPPSLGQRLCSDSDRVEHTLQHGDFEAVFDLHMAVSRYRGLGDFGGWRHARAVDNRDARRVRERAVELLGRALDAAQEGEDTPALARLLALGSHRLGALGYPESLKQRLEEGGAKVLAAVEAGRLVEPAGTDPLASVLHEARCDRVVKQMREALEEPDERRLEELLQQARALGAAGREAEALKEMEGLVKEVVSAIAHEKRLIAAKVELEQSMVMHDKTNLRLLNARVRGRDEFVSDRSISQKIIELEAKERASLLRQRLARNSVTLQKESTQGFLMRRFEHAVTKILATEAEEAARAYVERRILENAKKAKEQEDRLADLEAAFQERDVFEIRAKLEACKEGGMNTEKAAEAEARLTQIQKEEDRKDDLLEAIELKNLDCLKKAVAAAEKVGLHHEPSMKTAKTIIADLELKAEKERRHGVLVNALKIRNIAQVRVARDACLELNVALTKANKEAIRVLEEQDARKREFEAAVKSGNAERVRKAIEACQESRVSLNFMNGAAQKLTDMEEEELRRGLRQRVGDAIKKKNKEELKATMQMAEDAGVEERALGRARTVLDDFEREDAEEELREAIRSRDFEAIERKYEAAAELKADRALLTKAEVLIKELEPRALAMVELQRIEIKFDDGMDEPHGDQRRALFQVAHILQRYPDVPVSIHGHRACPDKCRFGRCRDSDPTDEKPDLSVARAVNVARALQAKGCKNVMLAKGWGCTHMEISNTKRLVRVLPPGGTAADDLTLRTQVRELDKSDLSPRVGTWKPITPRSWRAASPRVVVDDLG